MPNYEEDTYSIVFTSLKHPIRRRILRILSEGPRSFSDIQEVFRIESSHLTYHLESLGDLIFKIDDGKYTLSSLGEAAVSMMYNVEEGPPKTPLRLTFLSKRWKVLFAALLMGLILTSALCFFQYQTLNQLSSQYARLRAEHELVLEALREGLGLENFILTYEYTGNGSVASPLLTINDSAHIIHSAHGRSIYCYSIYSLTSNFTLEIEMSFTNSVPPNASLDISVLEPVEISVLESVIVPPNDSQQVHKGNFRCFVVVWGTRVTESGTYSGLIPSRGQHEIWIMAPSVQADEEFFVINYTMTLKIKSRGNYVPFFIIRVFGSVGN